MDLQYLLDLEAIKQLRYSFSWALETSAPDDLADLFTEDGWIDVGPWGRMEGQDQIRRGYGKAYGGAPSGGRCTPSPTRGSSSKATRPRARGTCSIA